MTDFTNEKQTMPVIRDFIYIDVERLNSLYSQVFQGVVNSLVSTELNESEDAHTQKGGKDYSGSTLEARVAAASYKTESKLLHDHMYNLLENRIQNAIIEPINIDSSNCVDLLGQAFMIKIRGSAEIWDYERLKFIFENFNEIGLALSYITNFQHRQGYAQLLKNLENEIKEVKKASNRKNEISQLQKQIDDLKKLLDPVEVAKNASLHFDESFLKSISSLTSTFYSGGLEVVIHPQGVSENILFRSVLDAQWLRISKEHLRALYAGQKAVNWIVVGQVTYVPNNDQFASKQVSIPTTLLNDSISKSDSEIAETVRDSYRNLVSAYYELEKSFYESKKLPEIIIHPIAIYRETTIPEVNNDQNL